MNKSTEMLKEMMEKRDIKWQSSWGGAFAQFVKMFDEEFAGIMFQKAVENTEAAVQRVEAMLSRMGNENSRTTDAYYKLSPLVDRAEEIMMTAAAVEGNAITDKQDAKTLILYRSLLNAGKEVFGEERMTESAIESICESASYIVYRSVMGPKFDTDDNLKGRRL